MFGAICFGILIGSIVSIVILSLFIIGGENDV